MSGFLRPDEASGGPEGGAQHDIRSSEPEACRVNTAGSGGQRNT
jgi:hypothetical protein